MHEGALASIGIAFVLAACASTSTPGANPHDMSMGQHNASAEQHAAVASAHQAQYDPNATESKNRCSAGSAARDTFDVCWTTSVNPTKEHLEQAEVHRKHAADHRAASDALRGAEANACAGIAADDRDISPFWHTGDIARVERLTVPDLSGDLPADRTVGAKVTFRAVPGMSAEWLQRVVDCHIARNSALGHVAPNMPNCPLVPRGVSADVKSTGDGFSVTIRADDISTAKEVLARAERLAQ